MFFNKKPSISESEEITNQAQSASSDLDPPLHKLKLLQDQFDDMIKVSSNLLQKKTSLDARNVELVNVVGVLQENAKEDANERANLKEEIHELKKKLKSTQAMLEKVLVSRNLVFEQLQDENLETLGKNKIRSAIMPLSSSRKNKIQQYVSLHYGDSFRIDGVSKRNRFKNLNEVLNEGLLKDNHLDVISNGNNLKVKPGHKVKKQNNDVVDDKKGCRIMDKPDDNAKAA